MLKIFAVAVCMVVVSSAAFAATINNPAKRNADMPGQGAIKIVVTTEDGTKTPVTIPAGGTYDIPNGSSVFVQEGTGELVDIDGKTSTFEAGVNIDTDDFGKVENVEEIINEQSNTAEKSNQEINTEQNLVQQFSATGGK
jgi:hypothetical protein